MTTNQTIDGVPRKWLQAYADLLISRFALVEAKEVRALLDAPAKPSAAAESVATIIRDICEHEPDDNPDSAHISIKALELILLQNLEGKPMPAAQHQGEPVVLPAKKCPKDWNKGTLRNCNMEYMEGYNDAVDDIAKLGPLYAEQPAPVAVVPDPATTQDFGDESMASGWNACLDEVRRLNP